MMRLARQLQGSSRRRPVRSPARAFTLVEVLVSAALVIIAMAAVVQIFNVSSDSAARTTANSDVTARAAGVREALTDQVSKIHPGLLIIESPTPTTVRQETQDGYRMWRQQHDRLVFLTHGDVDEYQSFTDPTRADPDNSVPVDQKPRTASSSEALVYFGPGSPLTISTGPVRPMEVDDDGDPMSVTLTASEWVFLHRTILLMPDVDANADPVWNPIEMSDVVAPGGMFDSGPLPPELLNGTTDAIVSDPAATAYPASARTFAALILQKPLDATDLLGPTPSIAALWTPSFAPRNATMQNFGFLNYYTRGGANFVPGLADFRVEWTDGGRYVAGTDTNGNDVYATRWFGLRPDPTFDVNSSVLADLTAGGAAAPAIPYKAFRRSDYTLDTRADEAVAFGMSPGLQSKIEWSRNGSAGGADSAYRAIWRGDTWQYRPKALRFTYRIYDQGNRLKQTTEIDIDEDGDFDPDDGGGNDVTRRLVMRWGRTFSIVVAVP